VATATTCWGMKPAAHLVVVMGTQYYDGTGLGASDYPVTDLIQMLGRASRPGVDEVRGKGWAQIGRGGYWGRGKLGRGGYYGVCTLHPCCTQQ
jgi:hypothetical protein